MTFLERLSSGWLAPVLLAALTFFASLPGVFLVPALDRDESRFAQASKQMLETGDYIQIRYQDEGRNKKPAGIHWLQAAATAIASEASAKEIWSYRLPSLIGAVLATLATFWCGLPLVGRRAAFLGAALFGSGLLLTSEAHIAKTDAVLVALTVVAMGALARLYISGGDGRQRRWVFLLWISLGLSFLIKGPVSMLVAGLAIVALCLVRREVGWVRPVLNFWAIGVFVLLVLPWFVWIQIATGGDYIEGAVGKDLRDKLVSASEGHGGWPGYHLAFLVTHFFPATLVLVPSLVLLIRTLCGRTLDTLAEERTGLLFLAAWAGPTWVFFELLPTKLSHYILPAYPALGLVCGWGVLRLMRGGRLPVSRFASGVLFAIGSGVLVVLMSPWGLSALQSDAAGDFRQSADAGAVLASWLPYAAIPLWLWAAGAVSVVATLVLCGFRQYGLSVLSAIAASLLIGWHIRAVALPGAVWVQPTVSAQIALAEVCAVPDKIDEACARDAPTHVRAIGYAEPSLVFTTGTKTQIPPRTLVDVPGDLNAYPVVYLLNLEDPAGVSARENLLADAAGLGRCVSESAPVYALNYSNGDPVAFVALRIDGGACAALPALRNGPGPL